MNNIKRNKADRKHKAMQKGALMRGISFEISYQEYLKYYEQPCVYCGIIAIGLDRIDSTMGYRKDNIVTCCTICNMMKASLERDAFITHCKRIAMLHTDTENIEEYCNEQNEKPEYLEIPQIPYSSSLENYEKEILKKCLGRHGGNQVRTAKNLNISTTTLWRKIKKYNITTTTKCNA